MSDEGLAALKEQLFQLMGQVEQQFLLLHTALQARCLQLMNSLAQAAESQAADLQTIVGVVCALWVEYLWLYTSYHMWCVCYTHFTVCVVCVIHTLQYVSCVFCVLPPPPPPLPPPHSVTNSRMALAD